MKLSIPMTAFVETVLQDIRFALRMLRKNPAFAIVAVVMLALGIGANTVIYSAVNAFLIRPLPYPKPEQIVSVYENNLSAGYSQFEVSGPKYLDWREQNSVFQEIGALKVGETTLTGRAEPTSILTLMATPSYLRVLGIHPFLGRFFTDEEGQQGKNQVAVLCHSLWKNRFGGDPNVIGQTALFNGQKHTIVGILPPGLFPDCGEAAFIPLDEANIAGNGRGKPNVWHEYQVIARLKTDVSLAQSQAAMSGIAQRLETVYEKGWGISIVSLRDDYLGGWPDRRTLFFLQGAVVIVLLIACANTASLMLARSVSRNQEMSIRGALGGSRSRILRQLLVESVVFAILGGAAGVALAAGGLKTLNHWLQWQDIRFWTEIRLDASVIAFSLVLTAIASIVFGLAPALRTAKLDLQSALRTAKASYGLAHNRIMDSLVVVEVGLALMLLIAAGLFARNLAQLGRVNPGFDPTNVTTMRVTLPESKYAQDSERRRFIDDALEHVKALPGVQQAAVITMLPMGGGASMSIDIEGKPPRFPNGDASQLRRISPDYFHALRVPLLKGRQFDKTDQAGSIPAAIINEAMARRYFPGENPIGARINIGDGLPNPRTIVGVVGDERSFGLKNLAEPILFIPHTQGRLGGPLHFIIRTGAPPLSLLAAIQNEIRVLDPNLAFTGVLPLDRIVNNSILSERAAAFIFAIFSSLALLLAALGIYGVMANAVSQRTHEIGIRIALGAKAADILRMVAVKGMALTFLGILLGLGGSFGASRLMTAFLSGISSTDAETFVLVPLILAAAALLACWLPARRAMKVDPMEALRCE